MGGSSEAAEVGCRIISTVDVLVVGGGPAGIGLRSARLITKICVWRSLTKAAASEARFQNR